MVTGQLLYLTSGTWLTWHEWEPAASWVPGRSRWGFPARASDPVWTRWADLGSGLRGKPQDLFWAAETRGVSCRLICSEHTGRVHLQGALCSLTAQGCSSNLMQVNISRAERHLQPSRDTAGSGAQCNLGQVLIWDRTSSRTWGVTCGFEMGLRKKNN